MGNVSDKLDEASCKIKGVFVPKPELSEFMKKKLLHEFHTFFDVNKDGQLEWKDFEIAREKVCKMSGWQQDTPKFKHAQDIFRQIWRELQDRADEDFDDKVSADEWLAMWTRIHRHRMDVKEDDACNKNKLPNWLEKYIEYKFNLFDRTADGYIDIEEFEYVLSDFGIPPKECRRAFLMFSENGEKTVDMDRFRELNKQFYTSEEPSALGNFISGKLDFS